MDFFDDPNISVSNVSSITPSTSVAFFDAGGTDLGLDAGIVFCNGNVLDVVGPNSASGISTSNGAAGDVDIDMMGGSLQSFDAAVIEFDFTVAMSDTLDFNYILGSDEYPEFANSSFNDAFGFFISGSGINGTFSNSAENISLIPNTTTPVEINTINPTMNPSYYIDNSGGQHLEYDGLTVPLPASFVAVAGETYHIKMVVADRGDTAFDSGVFLSFNSLTQDSVLTPPTDFQFASNGTTIEFTNTSKYARSWEWDFGNGQTSFDRNPAPITYATSGTYTVTLTTQNYCCTEVHTETINVGGVQPMNVTTNITNNPLACFGDTNAAIQLNVSGGVPPYTYDWSPNVPDLNMLGAGTYTISLTDENGSVTTLMVLIEEPPMIDITTSSTPASGNNGTATAMVAGGTPPYTYLWSNGATTETITDLPGGDYTVEVTDANDCVMTSQVLVDIVFSVFDQNEFEVKIYPNPVNDLLRVEFENASDLKEIIIVDVLGRRIPFEYDVNVNAVQIRFDDLAKGNYFLQLVLDDGKKAGAHFVAVGE